MLKVYNLPTYSSDGEKETKKFRKTGYRQTVIGDDIIENDDYKTTRKTIIYGGKAAGINLNNKDIERAKKAKKAKKQREYRKKVKGLLLLLFIL